MTRYLKTLWLLVRKALSAYGADNCSHMAAAISYYVLFSIIPLAVFAISIFGLIIRDEGRQDDLADEIVDFLNIEVGDVVIEPNAALVSERHGDGALAQIEAAVSEENMPQDQAQAIASALDREQPVVVAGITMQPDELSARHDNIVTNTLRGVSRVSGALGIVGLVGMAWSASAMFGAIRKSLNIAWGVEVRRPFVQQKLIDLSMVLGLGLLLAASVAGTATLRALREASDDALGPLSTGTGFFWAVLPFFLPAVASFVVFLLIYRYVPNARASFQDVWPGALLATALFEALKNGFALYIANFNSYDALYGSLGAVLLFMLWTYLTANILLIGAELAVEYPRVLRGDYAAAEAQPSERRSLLEKAGRALRGLFLRPRDEPSRPNPGPDAKA